MISIARRGRRAPARAAPGEVLVTIGYIGPAKTPIFYVDNDISSQDMQIVNDWLADVSGSSPSTEDPGLENDLGVIAGELRKIRLLQYLRLNRHRMTGFDQHKFLTNHRLGD